MEYKIPIKEGGLYKAILLIMDPFLNLNDGERNILVETLKIDNKTINSSTRPTVKERSGLQKNSFNNYIMSLKNKGLLIKDKYNNCTIHPRVLDMVSSNNLNITFYVPNKEV